MVQSIGAARIGDGLWPANHSVGQAGELAKLEKELSACINCDTAKTRAGQAKIEAISQRISRIRQQINRAEPLEVERQTMPATSAASDLRKVHADVGYPPSADSYSTNSLSPFAQVSIRIGANIDLLA